MSSVVPHHDALTRSIIDSLADAVAAAEHSDEPFSHLRFEGALPTDVYAGATASFPDDRLYRPFHHKDSDRWDGTTTRRAFRIDGSALERLPDEARELWSAVGRALASDAVKRAVFHALRTDLASRFGVDPSAVGDIESHPTAALLRDSAGYRIHPHTDTHLKIVTLQIYLPTDSSQSDLGTSIYRPAQTRSALSRLRLRRPEFDEVQQFPFEPNSGYAFAVSDKSWHGRARVPAGAGPRDSVTLLHYVEPGHGY